MGVHQFVFLERVEGYGTEIMKGYNFDPRDTMWVFSHSGINNVNIDVALEAKKKGMKVVAYGSAAAAKGKQTRHSSGKTIFDIADVVVDSCAPIEDATVPIKDHPDKQIGIAPQLKTVYTIRQVFGIGAEYYASLGTFKSILPWNRQEHLLGPMIDLYVHPKWEINAGVLFGLTDPSNQRIFKLLLGRRIGK